MKTVIPCNLTIEKIDFLFKQCIAKDTSKDIIKTILFQKEYGFEQESKPIFFDAEKIKLAKPQLEYSLGQLKDVHLNQHFTNTESIKNRYDNQQWTNSSGVILAYLHMLLAANLISPLNAKKSNIDFSTNIIPTLLISDPSYISWLKSNQSKLLDKYYGQEPADD